MAKRPSPARESRQNKDYEILKLKKRIEELEMEMRS